jgi:hypothetical protein
MEQVEDTQHTQQDKDNTLKSLLLEEVVPLWTETDFLKERKKEKKPSATIVCMKLILAKLITCGLPWSPPNFSIDNECHLQISFDVGEIHLYTLSLL